MDFSSIFLTRLSALCGWAGTPVPIFRTEPLSGIVPQSPTTESDSKAQMNKRNPKPVGEERVIVGREEARQEGGGMGCGCGDASTCHLSGS